MIQKISSKSAEAEISEIFSMLCWRGGGYTYLKPYLFDFYLWVLIAFFFIRNLLTSSWVSSRVVDIPLMKLYKKKQSYPVTNYQFTNKAFNY